MKRKTTKEMLAESFKELAAQQNSEKITIREIVGNCGYSSATFYRHFKDKYELVAWDYEQGVKEYLLKKGDDEFQWRDVCLAGACYHDANRHYFANLLQNTQGLYSFERRMAEINFKLLLECVKIADAPTPKRLERLLNLYCLGCVRCASEWLLGRIDATPEEIAEIWDAATPDAVRRSLSARVRRTLFCRSERFANDSRQTSRDAR